MVEDKEPPEPEAERENNEEAIASFDDTAEPSKLDSLLDYLETDKGNAIAERFINILDKAFTVIEQKVIPKLGQYADAAIEVKVQSPKIEFKKWVFLLVVRFLVFVFALGVVVYMKRSGNVDPTITLLIGGLVAYFFGYGKKES